MILVKTCLDLFVFCEDMKTLPFAIKISLNVNGSKNIRLNGRLPHIFTSPNLALFAQSLDTPDVICRGSDPY